MNGHMEIVFLMPTNIHVPFKSLRARLHTWPFWHMSPFVALSMTPMFDPSLDFCIFSLCLFWECPFWKSTFFVLILLVTLGLGYNLYFQYLWKLKLLGLNFFLLFYHFHIFWFSIANEVEETSKEVDMLK